MDLLIQLNSLLAKWEPIWLFSLIFFEGLVGLYSGYILTIEFWYDKQFNDNIKAARKERRRRKYEYEGNEGEMK